MKRTPSVWVVEKDGKPFSASITRILAEQELVHHRFTKRVDGLFAPREYHRVEPKRKRAKGKA